MAAASRTIPKCRTSPVTSVSGNLPLYRPHHHKNEHTWFAVTSHVGDRCCTYPDKRAVETSPTCARWASPSTDARLRSQDSTGVDAWLTNSRNRGAALGVPEVRVVGGSAYAVSWVCPRELALTSVRAALMIERTFAWSGRHFPRSE